MHTDELNSLLTNIEEFVFDEKKIVSCSWLSKTLGVHSNLSKQLLHTFFQNCQRKEDLSVTYLVIGLSKGHNSCLVTIVKAKDLEKLESDLETVTSKHIYSIQKCLELTDLNVLYTAQKEESVELIPKGLSAIDFKSDVRDDTLLAELRFNALPVLPSQPSLSKKADSNSTNVSKSPTKNVKVNQNNDVNNSDKNKALDLSSETKNSNVHPMFKNNVASKKKTNEKAPINKNKNGGIGAFFSKTAKLCNELSKNTPDVKIVKETKSISELKEVVSPKKENIATLNISNETNNEGFIDSGKESATRTKTASNVKPKVTSKKVETKKNKKPPVKKPVKEEKKRKRLVVLSDSDSNNSEDEKEVEREPTPEPQPSLLPDEDEDDMISGTPEPSKKRKKKLVSKSFTSPDGYLMTEKVYVSCSEEEEEMPAKKFKESTTEEKNCLKNINTCSETNSTAPLMKEAVVKPKNTSPQKVKQASLMSFFKKK